MLELVSMVSSVKIQQLAVPFKELRANSETAKYQSCSELGSQVPSVGTLVPLDSEIQVVAVQNLIKQIIFSYSAEELSHSRDRKRSLRIYNVLMAIIFTKALIGQR